MCSSHMAHQRQFSSISLSQTSLCNVPRRHFLHVLVLSCSGLILGPASPAAAFNGPLETFKSKSLHVSVEYPKNWFRSERNGSLVIVNLKDGIAATISPKRVKLKPFPDPFSAAYDMVRDRVENEGAEIFIKEAAFGPDDALVFRFEANTVHLNGDVTVRFGLSRCIPSQEGEFAIACIVTLPKESWDELQPMADRIVRSVRLT